LIALTANVENITHFKSSCGRFLALRKNDSWKALTRMFIHIAELVCIRFACSCCVSIMLTASTSDSERRFKCQIYDTKSLKGAILDWIAPTRTGHFKPPLARNIKFDRGSQPRHDLLSVRPSEICRQEATCRCRD